MMGGESDKICKDGASKSKFDDDSVCEVNDMLQNMSTGDKDNNISICANCGKEGSSDEISNTCNKCKKAMYCNAVCKKVHKKKHKKDCEEHQRLAAEKHNEELRLAAELYDEKLFKEPPSQHGDCPICFLRIPNLNSGWKYQLCCGKQICMGCYYAPVYDNQGNKVDNEKCPYCRIPRPTSYEEGIERIKKRVELGNARAIQNLGCDYIHGTNGYSQDYTKALELYHRAGELGHAMAYSNIGYSYDNGRGVEVDMNKAKHYYGLGAMGGDETGRYNLGLNEAKTGNMDRALKHYMIAAGGGYINSLDRIKELYTNGYATKDDYTKALRAYQAYLGEIKSDQRDEAAAADEDNRYCYY